MIRDYKTQGDVLVMAMQVTEATIQQAELFTSGHRVVEIDALDPTLTYIGINVPTSDGVKRASEGDYLVKELGGQVTVVRKNVFERYYDAV
jgi:hypothetical protein